jgi:two-component system cell cycle sensor histidine kinase/response regulator CckA
MTRSKKNQPDDSGNVSDGFYRALAESSHDIIFVIDKRGYVRYVNGVAAAFFGALPEEIQGSHLKDLFAPEAFEFQSRALRYVIESGEPFVTEENKSFAERRIWIETRLIPIKNRDGLTDLVMGVTRDITELKQSQEALREATDRLDAILKASPAAIVTLDPGGIVTHWNKAAEEIFGWRNEEVIGKTLPIVPEDKYAEYNALLQRAMHGESFVGVEVTRRKRDGSPLDINISVAPLHNRIGKIYGIMAVISDITLRKQTETELEKYRNQLEELVEQRTKELSVLNDQLRQSQKLEAVGLLAGGISHEFSNILATLKGSMYLMRKKLPEDNTLKRYAGQVSASINKANSLTQGLLAFSRKQTISLKPLHFNEIVRHMGKMLTQLIGEDIELAVILTDKDPTVMADRNQIEQVLVNLATNARDAMPDGGRLTMATEVMNIDETFIERRGFGIPGEYAVLTVADSGTGMEEAIFEPFFTTKAVGKGSGLGLAVTYGIVKQHSGYIDVKSAPGEGSTFEVYLPTVEEEVLQATGKEKLPAKGGAETILLAEDDKNAREIMGEILRMTGYTVLEAEDGEEAIRVFTENRERIQLAFLDVRMPKKNGRVAYEEIKRMRPQVKSLLMSGYTDEIIDSQGILEEGINFISKAALPDEILRKIREVLDQ